MMSLEKIRSKMQKRPDALFKQIARDSEYFDRDAAVFGAKHQRKSISPS